MAELKFRVVEVDPASGEAEGDQDGFPEEYPLEDIELSTADFIAKVVDFWLLVITLAAGGYR